MCDPRRVTVTATRQVQEAREREVQRVAAFTGTLIGEARIRQPLDASLMNGFPGWHEDADGNYRHDVEGGYVLYHAELEALLQRLEVETIEQMLCG